MQYVKDLQVVLNIPVKCGNPTCVPLDQKSKGKFFTIRLNFKVNVTRSKIVCGVQGLATTK